MIDGGITARHMALVAKAFILQLSAETSGHTLEDLGLSAWRPYFIPTFALFKVPDDEFVQLISLLSAATSDRNIPSVSVTVARTLLARKLACIKPATLVEYVHPSIDLICKHRSTHDR